jgi:predicted MFS family arabinose efflux permease
MGAFWGSWAALVPEIQLRTGASPPELGAALLWAGAGALPAMAVAGRLWRRLGRQLVSLMLLLFGLAAVLPALATSVVFLGASLALVGAASGALDVAMNAAVSDEEVASGRRLMYMAHALFSLAVLVMSLTAGALRAAGIGPELILGGVALSFLLVAAFAAAGERRATSAASTSETAAEPLTGLSLDRGLRRALLVLGVLCGVAFLLEDGLISWSALHLERSLDATPLVGGAGPGLFAGAMFAGRSAGQLLSRRFGDRDLLLAGGTVAAGGIFIAAAAPLAELALVGLTVAGAGISLVAPALFARAGRMAGPASRGSAVSTLTVMGYLGFIVGPPFVGLVAGATDLRVAFGALAFLALGLAVAARLLLPGSAGRPLAEPPVTRA